MWLLAGLLAFNVLNTQNRFVYNILDFTYQINRSCILNKIRRFLPNLGAFDISPIILLISPYSSFTEYFYV